MNRFILVAVLAALAFTTASADDFVRNEPGQVIVVLKENTFPTVQQDERGVSVDIQSLDNMVSRFDVKSMTKMYDWATEEPERGNYDMRLHWNIHFDEKYSVEEVMAAYESLPEVDKVFPNGIYKIRDLPNDLSSSQWYLRNTDPGGKDIRAVGGWGHAVGDTNIVIAIIDSGVDWQHPDLGGTGPDFVNGCIKINWEEWYGIPGIDDDSNGKTDDYRGWDFVSSVNGWPDQDNFGADNDPMDYSGHGTNCAGCSAAMTDNGTGIAGTAWGCKVMAIRVGWMPNGETQGVVSMQYASQGMYYAGQNGANIINCSWGSSSYLQYAVNYCKNAGCIIVNAAGNDSSSDADYLGTHPDVIAVAATSQNDSKASFSNYGSWVEVSAPGVAIYTTHWNQSAGTHTYTSTQGTSFSSPITCGALALLWSANPSMSRTQITDLLLDNCDNIDDANPGLEGLLGAGRINLLKALGDSFHKVPDELPTLFDAVNSAADGDTIATAGSTVFDGPITFLNTEIPVLGGWDDSFTSRDPIGNPTTIEASVISTGMIFESGTGPATVVDGFLVTGGGGQYFSGMPVDGRFGGGIILNQTSPTLRNIQITDCNLGDSSTNGIGGGVFMHNSNAILDNVDVHNSSAVQGSGFYIYNSTATLSNCDVYDNTVNTAYTGSDYVGGGMLIRDSDVTLNNCSVTGHSGLDLGGGMYIENSAVDMTDCSVSNNSAITKGCGIWYSGTDFNMTNCEISNNLTDPSASFSYGGGIFATGNIMLDGCTLSGNSAHSGAAILFDGNASAEINNSTIVDNTAVYFGAVTFDGVLSASATGNTVAGNSASVGGAGFHLANSAPTFENNLVAFNTGGSTFANGFSVADNPATFSCNDAYGNDGSDYSGTTDPTGSNGNISEDPQFCDAAAGDYGLAEGSPCIAAGSCGQIGSQGQECTDGQSAVDNEVPLVFNVSPNYPNPFNPMTTISFSLPTTAHTSVRVYDTAGRLVRTLVDQELDSAVHEVTWLGRDNDNKQVASGVYFYSVSSGNFSHTGRMALIK